MPTMEVADVLVNLGGDTLNSVPRARVTAAEIAVLQEIHGADAINEIKPLGKIERRHGVEKARLLHAYKAQREGKPIVELMFPGVAARVFERLNELRLSDEQFYVERRGVGGSARQAQEDADRDAGLALTDDMIVPLTDEEKASIAVRTAHADGEQEEDIDELPGDEPVETVKPLTAAQKRAAAKAAASEDAFA